MGLLKIKKYGFTMIELVLVIMIIAILAAIIVPRFLGQIPQAEIAATKANINNLRAAVAMYRAEQSQYPDLLSRLTAVPAANPYLRRIPNECISNPDKDTETSGTGAATSGTTGGWIYDNSTGNVWLNYYGTDGNDANGDAYSSY